MSARQQASGASFEATVDAALKLALSRGEIEDWWANYPRAILSGGRLKYVSQAPPDREITTSWGTILLEIKRTEKGRLPYGAVVAHQAARLTRFHRPELLRWSALAVEVHGRGYVVPWPVVRPGWEAWSKVKRAKDGEGGMGVGAGWIGMDHGIGVALGFLRTEVHHG